MSERSIVKTIAGLTQDGYVFRSSDATSRIAEEKNGLNKLKNRDDFLSSYNEVIRFMFILSLMVGYDIRQDKVHPTLKVFLKHYLSVDDKDISDLVGARHSLKYNGFRPTINDRILLSKIRKELIAICGSNG